MRKHLRSLLNNLDYKPNPVSNVKFPPLKIEIRPQVKHSYGILTEY